MNHNVKFDETPSPMLWTTKQASAALRISERKLWAMTASGEIPCVRLGRCKRYSVETISRLIDENEKGGDA